MYITAKAKQENEKIEDAKNEESGRFIFIWFIPYNTVYERLICQM